MAAVERDELVAGDGDCGAARGVGRCVDVNEKRDSFCAECVVDKGNEDEDEVDAEVDDDAPAPVAVDDDAPAPVAVDDDAPAPVAAAETPFGLAAAGVFSTARCFLKAVLALPANERWSVAGVAAPPPVSVLAFFAADARPRSR